MVTDLPRLLIVSEVSLSKEGMGANQTLFNLFEDYPSNQLMLFAPSNFLKSQPTSPPFDRQVIAFPGSYLPVIANRSGKLFNPLINAINFQLLDWINIPNLKTLEAFAPEVLLICPLTSWCLLMGYKITQHFQSPSLIYLMDDCLANAQLSWLSSNVQTVAYQLLKKCAGWLTISERLEEQLSNRYQLVPEQSLIVHNPVDLSGKEPPEEENLCEGTFRVIYAGSIWSMHYDAIAVVAEAIFELRNEGQDIELVLYTHQSFWDLYKAKWKKWQVVYGSLIPYCKLNSYLKQADLLLVATSFLPENAHVVHSSVLTKLTDYMAAGRPILSCGPDYSACNHFIKKWNCGLVCETNRVSEIKKLLLKQINNGSSQVLTKLAWETLEKNFEKHKVNTKLYDFIKNIYQKKSY